MQKVECSIIGLACNHHDLLPAERSHRHFEIELTFIESGSLIYLFGGKHIALHAGQLAVFWAALPHQVVEAQEKTILHWLTIPLGDVLRWRLPGALTRKIMDGQMVIDHTQACQHFDQRIFRRWHADLSSDKTALREIVLLECDACLRRLDVAFSEHGITSDIERSTSESRAISNSEWRRAQQAAHFIIEHYTHPLGVTEIARELGLHAHTVIRLFQKTFGMSIVEYVNQYRLAHAQRLLATTDATVLEIAIASGFGSPSRFYAIFSHNIGCSPRAYRQALLADAPDQNSLKS